MDSRLLSLAAIAAALALPTSAAAQQSFASGMHNRTPAFAGAPRAPGDFGRCRDGNHARHPGRFDCGLYGDGWAYADGEWAYSNNRSWSSDSYNDWWHDRPDRAFPRWVQEQRGGPCEPDRMWWSGSGWHC